MGSIVSFNMEDSSSDENTVNYDSNETNSNHSNQESLLNVESIVDILLLRNQTNTNMSSDDYEDEVESVPVNNYFNTTILDKNDFSFLTKQSCGLDLKCKKLLPTTSTIKMIQKRELGALQYKNYSTSTKCNISNQFLPNWMTTIDRLPAKVFCGIYSKDGSLFVSACQDHNIRFYNTNNGIFHLMKTVVAHDVNWSIIDVAFSPDGEYLVYSSWSDSLHIFKIHGDSDNHAALRLNPTDRRFCIFSVEFSSDGREIIGGANDGFLYIYNRDRNQRTLKVASHSDDVNAVAFADKTSQILYSGGDDGLINVWDRRTWSEIGSTPVGILAGHMDGITSLDSRGDGRFLITNSKDQSIKLWDIRVFSSAKAQRNTLLSVNSQPWDYRWQEAPSNFRGSKLKGDTSIMTYRGHVVLKTLVRCRFSPDFITGQRFIYTGCASGRIAIYDSLTGKATFLSGHNGCVRDVSWHPYKSEIASSCWDGSIAVWKRYQPDWLNAEDTKMFLGESKRGPKLLRRSSRLANKRRRTRT